MTGVMCIGLQSMLIDIFGFVLEFESIYMYIHPTLSFEPVLWKALNVSNVMKLQRVRICACN